MNNVNYDKLFCDTVSAIKAIQTPPTLLLNVCCAPCLTYCLTQLLPYFSITLYYDNDNITEDKEWQHRLDEVQRLTDIVNSGNFVQHPVAPLQLVVPQRDTKRYFVSIKDLEKEKEGGKRCNACFEMKLERAAKYAKDNGFDYFCTTLSVSPYKNSQVLNALGQSLAQQYQIDWLYADFKKRNGYKQSIALSQQYNLYRQRYCGCVYSQREAQAKDSTPSK